jgi:hypothetical protein
MSVGPADFESVLGRDPLGVGVCTRVCDRGGTGLLDWDAQAVASHDCGPEIAYVLVVPVEQDPRIVKEPVGCPPENQQPYSSNFSCAPVCALWKSGTDVC